MAQVAAGEFSSAERYAIDEAIRRAETLCRYEFSVFVGAAEGEPRAFATQLHNSLVAPSRSILIMVDVAAPRRSRSSPAATSAARSTTPRWSWRVLEMRTRFAEGDLVGGLKRGIEMLAEHARAPETLHTEPGST